MFIDSADVAILAPMNAMVQFLKNLEIIREIQEHNWFSENFWRQVETTQGAFPSITMEEAIARSYWHKSHKDKQHGKFEWVTNVVIGEMPDDIDMFDGEPFDVLPAKSDWTDVLILLGMFPSRSQAKKNGIEHEPCEDGLSQRFIGKLNRRRSVTVFKPIGEQS